MAFQYASDLHLNYKDFDGRFDRLIEPVCRNLVVAGDVTSPVEKTYDEFLRWCSRNFDSTVLVAGNHEYLFAARDAGMSVSDTDALLRDNCNKLGNVYYLCNGDCIDVDGIRFVGSCLWYSPDAQTYEQAFDDSYGGVRTIGKHRLVSSYARGCVRQFTSALEKRAKKAAERGMPTVAVTHFAPLKWCGAYRDCNDLSSCFARLRDSGVRGWVYGHTHSNKERKISMISVLSNQSGRNDIRGAKFSVAKVATVSL